MRIIFPVFPKNEDEKNLLWTGTTGVPLFYSLLHKFQQSSLEKIFTVTNDEKIFNFLSCKDISACYMDRKTPLKDHWIFPVGADASLDYLHENQILSPGEPTALIDCRNLLLTTGIFKKAYNKFCLTGSPILSVKKVADHPAQLKAYYRLIGTDIAILLDNTFSAEERFREIGEKCLLNTSSDLRPSSLVSTYPFFFDWEAYGIKSLNGSRLFTRSYREDALQQPFMVPLEDFEGANQTIANAHPIFFYESPLSARRLVNKKGLKCTVNQIVGFSCCNDTDHIKSLFIRENDKTGLYLQGGIIHRDLRFRVWPVYNQNIVKAKAKDFLVSKNDFEKKNKILLHKKQFFGPVCSFPADSGIHGAIVGVLQRTSDTQVDHLDPIGMNGNLWKFDYQSNVSVNLLTGKKIIGRQDFPDVFEPDGTFLIFSGTRLNDIESMIKDGRAEGFVLDPAHSCKIESAFDLSRLKAMMRARKLSAC